MLDMPIVHAAAASNTALATATSLASQRAPAPTYLLYHVWGKGVCAAYG